MKINIIKLSNHFSIDYKNKHIYLYKEEIFYSNFPELFTENYFASSR